MGQMQVQDSIMGFPTGIVYQVMIYYISSYEQGLYIGYFVQMERAQNTYIVSRYWSPT